MFRDIHHCKRKFSLVLADPAWKYSTSHLPGCAAKHYNVMSERELSALPVKNIINTNCILLMWCTPTHLSQAMRVMESWGFKYMTMFCNWVKVTKTGVPCRGLGKYTRQCVEFVLMGYRGSVSRYKKPKIRAIANVIFQRRTKHSEKPVEIFDMINKIFVEKLPKIELFSRNTRFKDWDYWGNQTTLLGNSEFHEKELKEIREEQDCMMKYLDSEKISDLNKLSKLSPDYGLGFQLEKKKKISKSYKLRRLMVIKQQNILFTS